MHRIMIQQRFAGGRQIDAADAAILCIGFHSDQILARQRGDRTRGRRMRHAEIGGDPAYRSGLAARSGEIAQHGPLAGMNGLGASGFINRTGGLF
jgi:hypothetical protein